MADKLKGSGSSEMRLGVLCINMDPNSREKLDGLITQTPGAYLVDNVDRHVTAREAMKMLEPFQHRVCVVDLDDDMEESSRAAQRLHDGCDATVNIFAASSDSSPANIITAMRCGCSEYLLKPFQPEQVLEALAQVEARRGGRLQSQKGRVITLIGAKGGTGVTSLALHLALHLVQTRQQKCLLVDQHPALGDVSLYLGLSHHQYSFYELVHNTDRLDADLLQGFLLQHPSGLDILDSPEMFNTFPNASSEAIEHTLSFLVEHYQFVIVDCPPGLSEDTCAAIRQSDRLEVVITPELPAVRNAIRAIEYLTSLHFPADSVDVVLNRQSKRSALSDSEVETALRRKIAVKIPNSYSQIVNSINTGTPMVFAHKSDLQAAFDQWVGKLMAGESAETNGEPASRGFLGLFGS